MTTRTQVWQEFADKAKPRRAVNAAGATTWLNWTQYPDHGPDESVLGDLDGRRVLELGSGSGSNLAHLATLGANCVGVDLVPSRASIATRTWGHLPNIEFVTADAVDYLTNTTTCFDIVVSIFGAVWFTDPAILFPLVRGRMTCGGVFAFSHLPALDGPPKAEQVTTKWHYPAEYWVELLATHGFCSATAEIIPATTPDRSGTLLVCAGLPDVPGLFRNRERPEHQRDS